MTKSATLVDLAKEEQRLLRLLVKQSAMLEVPPRNQAIESIVQKGWAAWRGSCQERWNYRMHECSTLSITDDGRSQLLEGKARHGNDAHGNV